MSQILNPTCLNSQSCENWNKFKTHRFDFSHYDANSHHYIQRSSFFIYSNSNDRQDIPRVGTLPGRVSAGGPSQTAILIPDGFR